MRWFIQNLLWQQSDSRCDCQIIGTNFIRSNRPALMRSPRSKVFSSLCACVDVQKNASLEMLQTLQMIRSLKLCRISSINSSVWNEMCSIKPCISLSLLQTSHRSPSGRNHSYSYVPKLVALHIQDGEGGLWVVGWERWASTSSRFVSSEPSRWDASRSCFLGYILRFQHISIADLHLTHYSR